MDNMTQKSLHQNNYHIGTNSEIHLPYCLTREYQMRVQAIEVNNEDGNRWEWKKTGIWDPKERND